MGFWWGLLVLALCWIGAGCSGGGGGGGWSGAGGTAGSAGSTGGAAGTGAAGAGATGGLVQCSGVQLHDDTTLELDVKSITVTGTVTLNGAPLPDVPGNSAGELARGVLSFRSLQTGSSLEVPLGSTGAFSYSVVLPPGDYAVEFIGFETSVSSGSACANASSAPMPCNEGIVLEKVSLLSSGSLDIDIPAVTIVSNVTINGQSADNAEGSLRFRGANEHAVKTIGLKSPDGVRLLPGTYDIEFVSPSSCLDAAGATPCTDGVLIQGAKLDASKTIDIDIPVVTVQGAITFNGSVPPADFIAEIYPGIEFRRSDSNLAYRVEMVPPANYVARLLPGTYDIAFAGVVCPSTQPCSSTASLQSGVGLTSSGVLDIDVPFVLVQGAVTLNGAPLPDSEYDRGSLTFRGAGGEAYITSLGLGGPAAYAIHLVPGTYDVEYQGNDAPCMSSSPPSPMPCNRGRVLTAVQVTSNGTVDVDVKAINVQGSVTVDGGVMPDAPGSRGKLGFVTEDGDVLELGQWGSTGPATYQTTLVPGMYDVTYIADEQLCDVVQPPVPCNSGRVLEAVSLTTDTSLDVDLPTVKVSGAVTLNGGAMPGSGRGRLRFERPGESAFTGPNLGFAPGPASFALTLLEGPYVIVHTSPACSSTGGPVPCVDQILLGCP